MAESSYDFEQFFDREGFNKSLSHFQAVSSLLDDFEDEYNLADILNVLLAEKEIEQDQLSPILFALLVDKYGYSTGSYNMEATIEDFTHFRTEAESWAGVDVVIAYHHPELGFTVINPKNKAHWESVQNIRKNELVTIYAGGFSDEIGVPVANKAIETCIRFLQGKSVKSPAAIQKGEYEFVPYDAEEEEAEAESEVREFRRSRPEGGREPIQASASGAGYEDEDDEEYDDDENESSAASAAPPAPDPAEGSGNRRMTPMYSVPVSNELFHNGNVEAWKKIIESYQTKYNGCEVLVFYEGERIHDINTLFKWGKVKHGSTILFAIVGEEIKDVAKLQRYFRQGASMHFEAFLRAPVNTVLKLF